jgi:hypothetical protein
MLSDKRGLHHIWTVLRPISTWYFVAAAIVFAIVGVWGLRDNYVKMTELRSAVYAADQNNGNVEQALQDLRAHVNNHMNTKLTAENGVYPPIQLKYTYQRLVQTEQQRANAANSAIYTDAQAHCERQFPGSVSGGPRVPCIESYVKQHGTTARTIPDAMYKFDFVSPRWSPDLAGWCLMLSGVSVCLVVLRGVVGRWLESVSS